MHDLVWSKLWRGAFLNRELAFFSWFFCSFNENMLNIVVIRSWACWCLVLSAYILIYLSHTCSRHVMKIERSVNFFCSSYISINLLFFLSFGNFKLSVITFSPHIPSRRYLLIAWYHLDSIRPLVIHDFVSFVCYPVKTIGLLCQLV